MMRLQPPANRLFIEDYYVLLRIEMLDEMSSGMLCKIVIGGLVYRRVTYNRAGRCKH